MISWGTSSVTMIFVKTPTAFCVLHFLLGATETGFSPGIILYLTYWYPTLRRSKVMALFMTDIPIASMVGGPLPGWTLDRFHNVNGMHEWRWLFLLESIPPLMAGVVTLFCLGNRARNAKWLDTDEKAVLEREFANDSGKIEVHNASGAFVSARV